MRKALWMGIDPSLTSTGVAFRTPDELLAFRLIPPAQCNEGSARLAWFDVQFRFLFDHHWRLAAIEGYSFGSRFSRSHRLGELGGLIRCAAYNAGCDLLEVAPKTLCMFMAGKGNLTKKQHCLAVAQRWNYITKSDDEADAVALASAAMTVSEKSYCDAGELDTLSKAAYLKGSEQNVHAAAVSRIRIRL